MAIARSCRSAPFAVLTVLFATYALGQNPKNERTEVTPAEYKVFSTYIAQFFVGKAATERPDPLAVTQIIIVDRTQYDESEIAEEMPWKETSKFLKKQVPSLHLTTVDHFREANLSQSALPQRFDLPLPYQLIAQSSIGSIIHGISDWPQYYKQYPGAQGFLTFSRVGFSPDGERAMFYATNYCGGNGSSLRK
jgi:hypothetical protein